MRVARETNLKFSDLMVPSVKLFEVKSPPLLIGLCSWSDFTNLEELSSVLANRIELELSDERTRVSNSPDPLIRGDSDIHLLISGFENYLQSYRPASEDELVEVCILMQWHHRYLWAVLGHFSLFGISKEECLTNIFAANDYSIAKLRVPRRGIGLSSKYEVCYGEFNASEHEQIVISHGLNHTQFDYKKKCVLDPYAKELSGTVWLCEVKL
jgi:hypothetical protein